MFKKTNKQPQLQSSESELSSDNEVDQTPGNHKIVYEPSLSSQSSSSQQEDGHRDNKHKQRDRDGYGHGREREREHEEADDSLDNQASDQDDDEPHHGTNGKSNNRNLNNNKKPAHRELEDQEQNSSQEEDSSDQSGTAYFRNRDGRTGISTIRQDPKESIEDESMDHIEMRIKKLQKDLQTRLHKHQQKATISANQQKNHGKIVSKTPSHPPPMPQKKVSSNTSNNESQNKMNTVNVVAQNYKNNEQQGELKIQQGLKKQTKQEIIGQTNVAAKDKKPKKDENPQIKQSTTSSKPASQHSKQPSKKPTPSHSNKPHKKQQNTSKNNHTQEQKQPFFQDIIPSQANNIELHQKMNEMSKLIKQLKLENQVLRQKLDSKGGQAQGGNNMQKVAGRSKSKNKMLEELQKIRESGAIVDQSAKLEKQIELLEVIEKLQTKLKKSINKKLAKQGNMGANLLHRGLPTTIQSNI